MISAPSFGTANMKMITISISNLVRVLLLFLVAPATPYILPILVHPDYTLNITFTEPSTTIADLILLTHAAIQSQLASPRTSISDLRLSGASLFGEDIALEVIGKGETAVAIYGFKYDVFPPSTCLPAERLNHEDADGNNGIEPDHDHDRRTDIDLDHATCTTNRNSMKADPITISLYHDSTNEMLLLALQHKKPWHTCTIIDIRVAPKEATTGDDSATSMSSSVYFAYPTLMEHGDRALIDFLPERDDWMLVAVCSSNQEQ